MWAKPSSSCQRKVPSFEISFCFLFTYFLSHLAGECFSSCCCSCHHRCHPSLIPSFFSLWVWTEGQQLNRNPPRPSTWAANHSLNCFLGMAVAWSISWDGGKMTWTWCGVSNSMTFITSQKITSASKWLPAFALASSETSAICLTKQRTK